MANSIKRYEALIAEGYSVRLREVGNGRWPGTHWQPALFDAAGEFVRPVTWKMWQRLKDKGVLSDE